MHRLYAQEFHDDVRCEDSDHIVMQVLSGIVIVIFVLGTPLCLWLSLRSMAAIYHRGEHETRTAAKAKQLAADLDVPLSQAEFVVRDMTIGRSLGFVMDAYRPQYLYWEALDMLRSAATTLPLIAHCCCL